MTGGHSKKWTVWEETFIKNNWEDMSDKAMAKRFNRTEQAVQMRRRDLGLSRGKEKEWTGKEKEFIKENYKDMTDKEIGEELDRTEQAVQMRRLELGLKKTSIRMWDEEEIEYLKENYEDMTDYELAQELDHPASSITDKRGKLGLKKRKRDKKPKKTITCDNCGKEIKRKPSVINEGNNYCSQEGNLEEMNKHKLDKETIAIEYFAKEKEPKTIAGEHDYHITTVKEKIRNLKKWEERKPMSKQGARKKYRAFLKGYRKIITKIKYGVSNKQNLEEMLERTRKAGEKKEKVEEHFHKNIGKNILFDPEEKQKRKNKIKEQTERLKEYMEAYAKQVENGMEVHENDIVITKNKWEKILQTIEEQK